jgi:hypothetical protein
MNEEVHVIFSWDRQMLELKLLQHLISDLHLDKLYISLGRTLKTGSMPSVAKYRNTTTYVVNFLTIMQANE